MNTIIYEKSVWLIHKTGFCVMVLCVMLYTCNRDKPDQVYFDKLFATFDSLGIANNHMISAKAVQMLDSAFKTVKNPGEENLLRKLRLQSLYFSRVPKYDSAIIYVDSAIALFSSQPPSLAFAKTYSAFLFGRGNICMDLKNYTEAINNYSQAKLSLQPYLSDPCILYDYYFSMAHVLYVQGIQIGVGVIQALDDAVDSSLKGGRGIT